MAAITSARAYSGSRVSSIGFDLFREPKQYDHQEDGPIRTMAKAIEVLEQSPHPLQQNYLAKASGYHFGGTNGLQTWLICLTFYDDRIYEEDDARLGLVGIHRDSDNNVVFDNRWAFLDSGHRVLPRDVMKECAELILAGETCRAAAAKVGIGEHAAGDIRRRMKRFNLL